MDELLYVIPANSEKEEILNTLKAHPEIKFVSLVGIDMAGNDTDEKIPMRIFLKDIDEFYAGTAVQTDGSSVVLTGIATLNNAKVDMPVDPSVNWFVDYNMENYDEESVVREGRKALHISVPSKSLDITLDKQQGELKVNSDGREVVALKAQTGEKDGKTTVTLEASAGAENTGGQADSAATE